MNLTHIGIFANVFKDRCANSFNEALFFSGKILKIALNPVMESWLRN